MVNRTVIRLPASIFALTAAAHAHAHPGQHGADWAAMAVHLVTEPDHLALLVLAVIVGVFAWRRLGRRDRN